MMIETHCHTIFSNEPRPDPMDPLLACEKAVAIGLRGITFTEHVDTNNSHPVTIDNAGYRAAIAEARRRFAGRLEILIGLEADLMESLFTRVSQETADWELDYLIGSQHLADDLHDGTDVAFFYGKTKAQAYRMYLEKALASLKKIDGFDMFGHINYITRYAPYPDWMMHYDEFADLLDAIFTELINKDKGLEFNTAVYYARKEVLPPGHVESTLKLLRRYRELGGEKICLASDAHYPAVIGYRFEHFRELLRTAGFRYGVYFIHRQPQYYSLI
jgi:histidinol-phosphatase (PHP family)